jgi:Rap1a immunity proteins
MRILITVLAVAAGTLAIPAQAAEAAMTAGDLKELCSGTDHVSRNVCRIYILGVTEGIAQGVSIASGKGARPCIPDGVSAERLEQSVKARLEKDLSASSARRTADAASFLAAALAEAFPCPRPDTTQQ